MVSVWAFIGAAIVMTLAIGAALVLFFTLRGRITTAESEATAAGQEAEELRRATQRPETEAEILERLIREGRGRIRQYRQALSPLATTDVTELTTRLKEARLRAELWRVLEEEGKLAEKVIEESKRLEAEEASKGERS